MGIFKDWIQGGLFGFLDAIRWDDVQKWIASDGNPENIGVGYANLTGRFPRARNLHAELRKEILGNGIRLHGAIYFDMNPRAASTRTWEGKKLDRELEKLFGHNLRIRIEI